MGSTLLDKALLIQPELDGVFCTNDDIAIGTIMACRAKQQRVPEDISVVGFNALDMGKVISQPWQVLIHHDLRLEKRAPSYYYRRYQEPQASKKFLIWALRLLRERVSNSESRLNENSGVGSRGQHGLVGKEETRSSVCC